MNKIEFMAWDGIRMTTSGIMFNSTTGRIETPKGMYVLQLTALRSINNEPIYNHMIVKDEDGDYAVIDMFDYVHMFVLSQTRLEIVGNRFQHPELLELCK